MSKCFLRLKIPCIVKPYGIIAFMEVFNRILSLRGHHVGKFLIEMFPGIRTSETACTCQVAALPAVSDLLKVVIVPCVWLYLFDIKEVIHTQALQVREIIQRTEFTRFLHALPVAYVPQHAV